MDLKYDLIKTHTISQKLPAQNAANVASLSTLCKQAGADQLRAISDQK